MKVLYVSDNRTGANWGCRATSIALGQLLKKKCELIATVYRDEKFRTVYWAPFHFLTKLANQFYKKYPSINLVKKVIRRCFFASDYQSLNIEQSAQRYVVLSEFDGKYAETLRWLDDCDAVVINGEGDFIFNPQRRTLQFLLTIIHLAHKRQKKVYVVNSIISPCPVHGEHEGVKTAVLNELKKCELVCLRDQESLRLLGEYCDSIPSKYVPDALFYWVKYFSAGGCDLRYGDAVLPHPFDKDFGGFDFSQPYICVSGSSFASQVDSAMLRESFASLTRELQKIAKVYFVNPCMDFFLYDIAEDLGVSVIPNATPVLMGGSVLANAVLYVSGRYHPSIMASCGGTPLICFESNSHKMRSLQELLGYDNITHYPLILDEAQLAEISKLARTLVSQPQVRTAILARCGILAEEVQSKYAELV